MLLVAIRDLQFRRRRFFISSLAVALVFALSLVLTGVAISFDTEIDHTLTQFGGDLFVADATAAGPFFGSAPQLEARAKEVAALPGVTAAAPYGFRPMSISKPARRGVNAFGVIPGQLGSPVVVEGSQPALGEAVIDRRAGFAVGDQFTMSGRTFRVSGISEKTTLLAGSPNVYLNLKDLQAIAFGAQPVITGIVVSGNPASLPPDLRTFTRANAHEDLLEPILEARKTIFLIMGLLWIVAAAIVASVIYLSASERMSEFAVFKATGVSTGGVVAGLVLQSAILCLWAVALSVAIAFALAPIFPVPVTIPVTAVGMLVVAGLFIGGLASIAAVRKALSVDPAIAFG